MKTTQTRAPRYGNYHVTRIAGTPLQAVEASRTAQPPYQHPPVRWQTLWADRPLELPHGRALGLRSRGDAVEVAFISKNLLALRWEPFDKVLTVKQALAWKARSGFKA